MSEKEQDRKCLWKIIIGGLILVCVCSFFSYWYVKKPVTTEITNPPTTQKTVSEIDPKILEFGLKIEKLSILVPIIKDVDGSKKSAYNKALEQGVAHYKGTGLPGSGSNIFIFGHSSTILGKGDYAEVFAQLNDSQKGDKIVVYYQNKEYQYEVTSKKTVEKTETSILNPTKTEQLTLMTCWPIGTNAKRLIIIAKKE